MTAIAGRVVVVGSVNVDRVLEVVRLPAHGETVHALRHARKHGGKGANQAVAAAAAGAPTWIVACVGEDADGQAERAHLAERGVDVSQVLGTGSAPTGEATVIVGRDDGENQIVVASGANAQLTGAHVTAALDRVLGGRDGGDAAVLVNLEVGDGAVSAAADGARRHGASFVLNPAPVRRLPTQAAVRGGIVTPNEHEARELLGLGGAVSADPELLGAACSERLGDWRAVVITLGARGAALVTADGCRLIPAPVVDAVDTTGAGDVFNGVLAAAIVGGAGLVEAVARAVAAASDATRHLGAQPPHGERP